MTLGSGIFWSVALLCAVFLFMRAMRQLGEWW
jgi:hypothetical protein